jgi:alkylation response protein AidB-like acyl-CoA dehydrogenase
MNLELSEEQQLLRDTFAQLFETESSPARVRAAEPLGFDPALWKVLAETGAPGIRVPEAQGGSGAGLMEAVLLAEQVGRHLASGPVLEAVVASGLLARCTDPLAQETLRRALDGTAVLVFAPRRAAVGREELIPGGAVADAVVGLDGDALVLLTRGSETSPAPENLGANPVARWNLSAARKGGERRVLAGGADARRLFGIALDEWRLLTATALAGLGRRAVEIAAAYATERIQFDRPIGAFQGIAHPLANAVTDVEGARLLVWYAVWSIARNREDAAALIPYALGWAARASTYSVARALHTHGGYGLSLEYDIQLFHRRGKAWALAGGDPRDLFVEGADRRWGGGPSVPLPEAGDPQIDFGMGEKGEATRLVARRFFEENVTPEMRATLHFSWDGHDPELARKLAQAGLLFPTCAPEHGGRSATPYEAAAIMEEYAHAGVTTHAVGTTHIVAETVRKFGSPELQAEVMPNFARGGANCALGYTEPGSGSDVAAAQTRAVRDGDHWVINGQKMFTSGAHIAQYVFLLTRTDPAAKKHRGLTMFLVPIDTPGIEIQPIHTLSDERTNATYYTNVRVPDRYRVGPVDGGWSVLHHALDIEHGGGGFGGGGHEHRKLAELAAGWAHQNGRWSDPRVRERIGFVGARSMVNRVLGLHGLWSGAERRPDAGEGPMYSLFSAEAWIEDAADMMDLCAPDSILKKGAPGSVGDGEVELAYRHSTALSIYGGSSEIMRSIIAQLTLKMPRSRS